MAFRRTAPQPWLRELLCFRATTAQIHNEASSLPRWHCGIQGQNSSPADHPAQGSEAGPSAVRIGREMPWQHRVASDLAPRGVQCTSALREAAGALAL